jgi:hypothetical protein
MYYATGLFDEFRKKRILLQVFEAESSKLKTTAGFL